MQPVPNKPDLNQKPNFMRTIIMRLLPVAIGLVLVIFPFDWLANVWPEYRQVFQQVFVGAREHHLGHITLFFIVGFLILLSYPALRSRPFLYFGLLISAALAQEAVQDILKFQIPDLIDGLDLLFDAIGFTVAYLIVYGGNSSQGGGKRDRVITVAEPPKNHLSYVMVSWYTSCMKPAN